MKNVIFVRQTATAFALGWLASALFITSFSRSDGYVVFVLLVIAGVASLIEMLGDDPSR